MNLLLLNSSSQLTDASGPIGWALDRLCGAGRGLSHQVTAHERIQRMSALLRGREGNKRLIGCILAYN